MRNLLLLLLLSLSIFSCSKDEETDPCENITCVNGGVCVNGVCDCPEGYTGPDCGDEEVPRKMRVLVVRVLEFPPTDENGASWDFGSGADIFFTMSFNGNFIYRHNDRFENADHNKEYTFVPSTRLNLSFPEEEFQISLYDYDDLSADDFMRGIRFVPYREGLDFPKTVRLDAGQNFVVELDLEYSF